MDPQQFVTILIEINAKLNPLIRIDDTLKRILVKEGLEEPDTPTPPIVIPMITEFRDVPKEFQVKSPPICDTYPEIESDFKELTYHPDIDSNFNEDVDDDLKDDQVDEELGDDIIESSSLIFLKAIIVITRINDVFPKDNTPIPPEVTTITKAC